MTKTTLIRVFCILLLPIFLLTACSPATTPQPTPDIDAALTQVVATINAGAAQTSQAIPATAAPTETPVPAPTVVRTPPALPGAFVSTLLNPLDTPHAYIQDTCQVLKAKWDPNNSVPGTLVMPIMFHSITKGEVTEDSQISITEYRKLMNDLHGMGFQAIDMQQAADFMYNNAKIPQRSVLLIVDDRKYREYFDKTFKDFFDQWGWKVVNAWISAPDTNQVLWDENAALESEGWVDHQAHGVIHNVPIGPGSSDDYIHSELYGAIQAIQQHFNKTPIAYIWPGGGFTPKAAQVARQAGYKLGFTINPRGPLMFNWVPLTDQNDSARPSYMPEGAVNDPLMILPRYWDTDARSHLDTVRNISDEAIAFEEKNKATELEYYDIVCAPKYGPIPGQ